MDNYAIILRNLKTRPRRARKRFNMTAHDPRDIPATRTNNPENTADVATTATHPETAAEIRVKPDPIETGRANIDALLRLAGKTDLDTIGKLQSALMNEIDLVRQAIYLLTSTSDQPAHLNFGQLISQPAIDAYRDTNGNPLPGAISKGDGLQTHLIEIPYDDPACTPDARCIFLQHLLIPQARDRIKEMLAHIAPLSLYAKVGHDHSALFSELSHRLANSKLSRYVCQAPALEYNGSPCFVGEMPEGALNPPYVTA